MSNSPLVSYTRIAKHFATGRRWNKTNYSIDRITPHCVVGLWTAKQIADYFATTDRDSSPNYGIGKSGDVSLCVDEKNRSFCSSSGANDARSVTIECASDTTSPYRFPDKTYQKLVDLCEDICRRNGKNRLIWIPNKTQALSYTPHGGEMLLTVHRWFASKACPGDWLVDRMGDLATEVTRRLQPEPKEEIDMTKDEVQKMIDDSVKKALAGKDLPASEWAVSEGVVSAVVSEGITDGTRPQGCAKREEVWAMILRALKVVRNND